MERNRHLDLLRVVAIGGVVYGHWLLVDVTYSGGRLSGLDGARRDGHELAAAVQAGRIGRMRSQRRDFGVPVR